MIRALCRRLPRSAALILLLAGSLHAQRAIEWSKHPVLLMTMGQGDEVFEKFGHNAVVVWDDQAGMPLVYNWGMFDFQQPNFVGRFLSGDTKYWMQPFTWDQTLSLYQQLNRTLTVQELQLTAAQKARLVVMLRENAREENKFYRYDYYRDNCSTRARDAIDAVTNGALKRAMQAQPGQGSYRWHTRRLLAYSDPLYFGSELVLGVDADAPLTRWQEAFLPQSLSESLLGIVLPAADGVPARPLVAPIDTVYRAGRDAEPRVASLKIGMALVIGLAIAALIVALARVGRIGAAIAIGGWSLVATLVGCLLLYMWFATKHVYMAKNPTVALLNPLWLVGVVAAVMTARRGVSPTVQRALCVLPVIGVIVTGAAIRLGHAGSALELAALVLPGQASVIWVANRFSRSRVSRP